MNLLCMFDPLGFHFCSSKVGRIFASPYRQILDTGRNTLKCCILQGMIVVGFVIYSHCIQLALSFLKIPNLCQDGWGENDGPVAGTRHPSWEKRRMMEESGTLPALREALPPTTQQAGGQEERNK